MLRKFYETWQKAEYQYPTYLAMAAGLSLYAYSIPLIPLLWLTAGTFGLGFMGAKLADLYNKTMETIAETRQTVAETRQAIAETRQAVAETRLAIQKFNEKIDPTIDGFNHAVADARQLIQITNPKIEPTAENLNKVLREFNKSLSYTNAPIDTVKSIGNTMLNAFNASAPADASNTQSLAPHEYDDEVENGFVPFGF